MTEDFRTRIAKLLYRRHLGTSWRNDDLWDLQIPDVHAVWLDDADAVIRELGQEWRINLGDGGYEFESDRAAAAERLQEIHEDWGNDPPESGVGLEYRYVTEWKWETEDE